MVAGAVVSSYRLGQAVELDQYSALLDPALIDFSGSTASKEASTGGEHCGNSKFSVFVTGLGVGDRALTDNPVCLGHCVLLSLRVPHPLNLSA